AGYGFSKLQPSVYQAATRLLVTPSRADNGLVEYAKKSIGVYQVRLQSRDFISQALASSDDPQVQDDNPDTVLGGLKVQVLPDNLTINITQDDRDPVHAAALLNTISAAFVEMMNGEAVNSTSSDKLFLV